MTWHLEETREHDGPLVSRHLSAAPQRSLIPLWGETRNATFRRGWRPGWPSPVSCSVQEFVRFCLVSSIYLFIESWLSGLFSVGHLTEVGIV